jgi:hypothetical protein
LQLDLELHTEKLSHILEDTSPAAIKGSMQAILHLTQVAKNVYHGLMDSVNEWSATGAVTSPPHSPPLRSSKSHQDLQAKNGTATAAVGQAHRRKGSQFLKKLFRRTSEADNLHNYHTNNLNNVNNNNNNNNNNNGVNNNNPNNNNNVNNNNNHNNNNAPGSATGNSNDNISVMFV